MEFPIFSFFLSMLSVITGNGNSTTSINSSIKLQENSTVQNIILTVVGSSTTTIPTIVSTTTPPEPLPPDDLSILCPEVNSSDFNLMFKTRYYNRTKKCYSVESIPTQGPCRNNMAFFADDDLYGDCACKIDNRLLIYSKKHNECFYIFQRAYCGRLQWLDITRNGAVICTRNPCASFIKGAQKDLVLLGGRCVEVGKPSSICSEGEVVGFQMFKRAPICVNSRTFLTSPRAIGVPLTPCTLGSVRAIDGRCYPPFDFD